MSHKQGRRKLIKGASAAIVAGLAGCTGGGGGGSDGDSPIDQVQDSDDDGVPDSEDDYPNDPDRSEQLRSISDTRNLEEDQWRHIPLEFSQTGYIEYDFIVRDGPAIDVILLDESEYQYFDEGERSEYYPELSATDSTGDDVQGEIPSGTYRLILDNSNRGEATPPTNFSNDVVSVEYSIETSQ
ncbi:hypothetical protein [Halorubrum xinjiangense]|uniref:hypothetical protein n=1 Tax=Halorubrum xinjiangense TaxID=261291 RepID=UPI00122D52E2|nr:hypothetical protein [Halorubrum xinjiangense]